MKCIDVIEAKKVYLNGDNVTNFLRSRLNSDFNTPEIIEIAYDLQAGTYINHVNTNRHAAEKYASEISSILIEHLHVGDSLLDVGTGEMTTISLVLNELDVDLGAVLAFDISWSRLSHGQQFYRENSNSNYEIIPFVADIGEIPLHSKSVDVVTSSHALEPNGSNLEILLKELFRVTKKKLVLFEPSYELNSQEGQERMTRLGYIKNIERSVNKLGGKLVDFIPLKHIANPLNPTACYVIQPPSVEIKHRNGPTFTVPGTDFGLKREGYFLFSNDTGLVFPILEDIAVLKASSAILATSKSKE